jgi:hypothetical protein
MNEIGKYVDGQSSECYRNLFQVAMVIILLPDKCCKSLLSYFKQQDEIILPVEVS